MGTVINKVKIRLADIAELHHHAVTRRQEHHIFGIVITELTLILDVIEIPDREILHILTVQTYIIKRNVFTDLLILYTVDGVFSKVIVLLILLILGTDV